jgi:hypothetical protein
MSEAKFSDELSVLFAAAEAGRADVLKSILDVIDKNEPFSGAGRLRKAALTQVTRGRSTNSATRQCRSCSHSKPTQE